MPLAVKVDGAACPECGAEDVFYDVKEEPSCYKVGAVCHACDRDFGVLHRISRSNIDHADEIDEEAGRIVREEMD